jgi:hypothetical protein
LDQLIQPSDKVDAVIAVSDAVVSVSGTRMSSWSSVEQLQMMLGEPPTSIRDKEQRRRMCRSVMIAVADWMDERRRRLIAQQQLLEPLESEDV